MDDLLKEEKQFISAFDLEAAQPSSNFEEKLKQRILKRNNQESSAFDFMNSVYPLLSIALSVVIAVLGIFTYSKVYLQKETPVEKTVQALSEIEIIQKVKAANQSLPQDLNKIDLKYIGIGTNDSNNYFKQNYTISGTVVPKICGSYSTKLDFTWQTEVYRDDSGFYWNKYQAFDKKGTLEHYVLKTPEKTYVAYPTIDDFATTNQDAENELFWEEDVEGIDVVNEFIKSNLEYIGEKEIDGVKYYELELTLPGTCFDKDQVQQSYKLIQRYYARQSDFVVDRRASYEEEVSEETLYMREKFEVERKSLGSEEAKELFKYDLELPIKNN